ncbi:large neutral amino acids transporter small subunit 2-like protein [Leptotrombidium deliense]|uniref:Large neutral amino acids transporter small subunit 2-like protein n=1 Tax=Leptotrombidium deliense TaxID=299467 RepID=A0A443S6G9_9ACAR|nr:large neutral amino acids transporter small subunit 2-like protein [Leptotrombidium deliense]
MFKMTSETRKRKDERNTTNVELKKSLGLLNGVSLTVGIIIGSGIFVSPKGVLQEAGSIGLAIIIWIISGLLSTVGALCYAELGTAIPKSGGDYAYIAEAFGPLPAFLFLWVSMFIIIPASNAITGLTFANYILQPLFPNCTPPENAVRIIAALLIVFLTFINCVNVKWANKIQNIFTAAKVLALLIIIYVGIVALFNGKPLKYKNAFIGTTSSPGHIALAFYSGLYSYGGWNSLNFVTEELRNPFRNLPRAIYISMPLITAIYVLTNIAYFAVLLPEEVMSSNAVAVSFGEKTMGFMAWLMSFSVALSCFGNLNGGIFASSRLFFVGAREQHLPSFFAMINMNNFTPVPSLIFLCLTSAVYLMTTEVYVLINYTAFTGWFFISMSIAALIWLRIKQPNMKRPIKVNILMPIIFILICIFLVTCPFYLMPVEAGIGLIITFSGVPIYFLTIFIENKPNFYQNIIDSFTIFLQKLLCCVHEDKQS